jgi:hypothetical protein
LKFNPLTKEVFTDKDEFIKKLDCPFKMKWDDLKDTDSTFRKCSNCDRLIVDTKILSDDQLLETIKQGPHTCFKIDLNQHNVTLTYVGDFGNKH